MLLRKHNIVTLLMILNMKFYTNKLAGESFQKSVKERTTKEKKYYERGSNFVRKLSGGLFIRDDQSNPV